MCGGSRFMWPLSDVMKKPSQGAAESWAERLLDPAELQDSTGPSEDGILGPEMFSQESETVV